MYVTAIRGSHDAPGSPLDLVLARLGYLLQLAVLLFWVLERSPGRRATSDLLEWLERALPTAAMGVWIPGVAGQLQRVADLLDSLVDPPLGTVSPEES